MTNYDNIARLVIDTFSYELGVLVEELGRPICPINDEPVGDLMDAATAFLVNSAQYFGRNPDAGLDGIDEAIRRYEGAA